MNRNTKHPDRPHKRKPSRRNDHTQNKKTYRVTASWDRHPDRPAIRTTQDKQARDRMAREFAEQGAYVIVEQYRGAGEWRTVAEIDGASVARERRRVEQEQRRQAEADRRAAVDARRAEQAAARRTAAERASLERLMTRPPVMRDATGRVTARHTAGA